jgi:ribose transport system substrate-binding protein
LGTRDGGLRVMTDLLTAFPKIDAAFATNDPAAIRRSQARRAD